MVFRSLALCLLLLSALSHAQGRKPAVEDFVGIEVEEAEVTPQGTESLFNLQQDITNIEARRTTPKKEEFKTKVPEQLISSQVIAAMVFALSLPLAVLLMLMARMKKKASLESASNIEVLEKYRKEKEKKMDEATKKAS
jgi:hypothetical protein